MKWATPDVLVIGGGAAAAVAALEASKNADVMMISKDRVLGGASIQAGGGISVPGVAPDDQDPDLFINDTVKAGEGINNLELVKLLANSGKVFFEYLEELGVFFDKEEGSYRMKKRTEGHSVARSYQDRRMFHEIGRVLRANLAHSNVDLWQHAMVFALCTDENSVIGAIAFHIPTGELIYIVPRSVVIATGGFGQLYRVSDNAITLNGEGASLALECGAELMDMEMVQFIPLSFPYPESMLGVFIGMCSLFGPKVKLYNGLGERFMERYDPQNLEFSTRDKVARAIFQELISGRGTQRGTIIVDPTENDRSLLQQYYESTPTVYSMLARVFGEKAALWEAPFEAVPAQHFCCGGIRIDVECRTSCKNLFAVGEVSAGLHGANRLGGNALLEVIIMGKIAGASASKGAFTNKGSSKVDNKLKDFFKKEKAEIEALLHKENQGKEFNPYQIKRKLQQVMWEHCGIVRNDRSLQEGLKKLTALSTNVKQISLINVGKAWNYALLEALEVKHMLRVAEAVLKSAAFRKESRGAHYNEDYPQTNPLFKGNTIVSMDHDGNLNVKFHALD